MVNNNNKVTLHSLWNDLDDVPIDGEGRIEHDYHIWEKGTFRYDIETWFDETLPIPLQEWLERGMPHFDENGRILKNKKLVVSITTCHGNAKVPKYARKGDAGMDLISTEYVKILPGERIAVDTGIKIALPEGYEAQVRPRSGLALKHGITVLNSPGTIDSCFRGEIKVILINLGTEAFEVQVGMAIAQMVIAPYTDAYLVCITNKEYDQDITERGSGGFGSTGGMS